jgi:hypothetical protein
MPKATQKSPFRFKSCHFLAVCRVAARDSRNEMRGARAIRSGASFIGGMSRDEGGTTSIVVADTFCSSR